MMSTANSGQEIKAQEIVHLRDWLIRLQERIQRLAVEALRQQTSEHLAQVARESIGDTLYEIDRQVDGALLEACERLGHQAAFVLVAEGCTRVFPAGATEDEAAFRLVVDPLDGTRGFMYDKRSAWTLAAVAPNRGQDTRIHDIELAVQTEIPTTKQYLADMLWATRGAGAHALRRNLLSGEEYSFRLQPSRATDLSHGFGMLSKFFPGRKAISAEIEDRLYKHLAGHVVDGRARVFDDQYISTGGQFYELAVGHDRFSGDIRAALMAAGHLPGYPPGLAVHPYDVCTELIAREAGVIVTDLTGRPLGDRLREDGNVSWLAYANRGLQERIEPILHGLLNEYGLT